MAFIDAHAHFFPRQLNATRAAGDDRWPRLDASSAFRGKIMLGDRVFRDVSWSLWDTSARLAEMDSSGCTVQVLSPVPITLTYWAEDRPASSFMRVMNESLADEVSSGQGRFVGLGTVPLQHPASAVRELKYLTDELGLAGVEIGSSVNGAELDDPSLAPFFQAVEDLDAVVFVHPMDGGADVVRRSGQPYDFGLGMLTDTALAASALVFGGVLARHPGLRILMAHGCGTFAAAYPRLRWAARVSDTESDFDALAARIYVDSLVLDQSLVGPMQSRFGTQQMLIGTDFPFLPEQVAANPEMIRRAARDGILDTGAVPQILSGNAMRLFGLA